MPGIVEQGETWEDDEGAEGRPGLCVRPSLFLVLEADRPSAAGARFDLVDVDEVLVGRGAERHVERRTVGGQRQLRIGVPDRWLSTLHARLRRDAEGWSLEDAGSRNGSSVRGHRVQRARLADGDRLQLGHTLFVFRASMPAPADGPHDVDLSREAPTPALATTLPGLGAEYATLERIARSPVPVVLVGETGTGKEVLARALHGASGRNGPFVAFNCGAISQSLKESQLFGHVRGAFTGALRDELGLVRAAHGGTLLLDEVVELEPSTQVALLRVLQERQVVPVGSSSPADVDVRFVAAALEPLQAVCDRGRFRSDLLARLDGFTFTMRPLRERIEDLGVLIANLLRKHVAPGQTVRIAPEAAYALMTYSWPLNVRELEQCLVRSLALAERGTIRAGDLPPAIGQRSASPAPPSIPPGKVSGPPRGKAWTEADSQLRQQVLALMDTHNGNVTEVARVMGKARSQVQRWLRRFEIDGDGYRRGR